MRDRQALENLNRAAHRGHAIICAFDAVLSGLSLMGVAFSEYVAEGTCPDSVILRVPAAPQILMVTKYSGCSVVST